MENPRRDRVTRRFVGLFSVYAGDSAPALYQSLWTMLRNQSRPLDRAVGVIEGDLSDDLESVVTAFGEVEWLRIPKVLSKLDFGLPVALNHGLSVMQPHDVVLKIDTDDLYPTGRVALTAEAFESDPELGIFGGQIDEWTSDYGSFVGSRSVPLAHADIVRYGKRRNPFNGPTVAFCAQTARELGGFAQVGANEDYVLWANMLHSGVRSQNSPEVLTYMRGGSELVHRRSTARTRKGELEALNAIRKHGFFSIGTYMAHVVGKQIVRRLPLKLNLYLYKRLRQGGERPVPGVVALADKALHEWHL
jgi:hypothetical protein